MRRISFRDAIAFAQDLRGILKSGELPVVMSESEMSDIAADEVGYRRLTDNSNRDLAAWDQKRMQDVAYYLYRRNHLGRRVVHLVEDFVVGSGVQVTATEKEVQSAIDTFWKDPVNDCESLNGPRVREWQLWGEICLPVTEASDGRIRIGWIDPGFIDKVEPDPRTGLPGILTLTTAGAESVTKKELRVISFDDKEQAQVGDCFFSAINSCLGGRRGVSEIYTAADWIDALEEILFSSVDRSRLLNSFIWDVTLEGFNEARIKAWMKKNMSPPGPASIRAHNQKVTWKAEAPSMQAYETSRQSKDLLAYTLGGLGIPSHWYGAGDDANLATAAVMAEPTRRMLKRKQREFTALMTKVISYQLQRLAAVGSLSAKDLTFEVKIPDFSGPDIAKSGAAVAQAIAAVQSAEESLYVSKRTARSLAAVVLGELGPEIDPDEESAEIEKEQKEKAKVDAERAKVEGEKTAAREEALQAALRAAKPRGGLPVVPAAAADLGAEA